jgi:hypothetical protein
MSLKHATAPDDARPDERRGRGARRRLHAPEGQRQPPRAAHTIARLVPEGQTMTAPITDKELARLTNYYFQSVRNARDVLEHEVRVIRTVGGGQGRAGTCYELRALPGAGAPPTLPLRADLRPVARRSADAAPTLFDPPATAVAIGDADLRSDDVCTEVGDIRLADVTNLFNLFKKYSSGAATTLAHLFNLFNFYSSWFANLFKKYRSTPHVLQDDPPTTKYQDLDPGSGEEKK